MARTFPSPLSLLVMASLTTLALASESLINPTLTLRQSAPAELAPPPPPKSESAPELSDPIAAPDLSEKILSTVADSKTYYLSIKGGCASAAADDDSSNKPLNLVCTVPAGGNLPVGSSLKTAFSAHFNHAGLKQGGKTSVLLQEVVKSSLSGASRKG